VRQLAAFASSDAGKAFARIEERFGRDPAAALEPLDDVLAHNLRAAFVVTLADESEETDEHRAEIDRLRKVDIG
jgi:N-acyl-D-aspartate/D-glutamate deacylase